MARKWTDYSDSELYGLGLAVGIAVGLSIGALLHNVGAGIAIGAGLGVAFAEWFKQARNRRRARDTKEAGENPDVQ